MNKQQHDAALKAFQAVDWERFIKYHDLVVKKFCAEESNSITTISGKSRSTTTKRRKRRSSSRSR